MVRGDDPEAPARDGAPHLRRLMFAARGRRVHPFGTLEARSIQVFFVEVQVMGARLTHGIDASGTGALDLLDRLGAADVDKIDGRADDFSQGARASSRFGLDTGRTARRVVLGVELALGYQL